MKLETKILLTTIIACTASIAGGFGVGFVSGMKFQKQYQIRPCSGYTVLDARHVTTCSGDTIYYDWKKNFRPIK